MQEKLLEVVEKAKQGDQQASTDLFEMTERMVYFTALKFTGCEETARDIVQDTYINVFTELSKLHDNRAFISWIKSIVTNLCKNHMKKRRPILFASDEEEMRALEDIPEVSEDFLPEEYALRREKSRLVMQIVDSLPEAQRMTVILYYYNELPVSEVARIMEVSEGTVKSRLNYARKYIRDEVVKLEKEDNKLYAVPLLLLSRILQNASLDYSLPQNISNIILAESLESASGLSGSSSGLAAGGSTPGPGAGTTGASSAGGGFTGRAGGFSAINNGEIINCYSLSKVAVKRVVSGGFSGENLGNISHSFFSGPLRGIQGGISGIGKGESDYSYYFHDEPDKKLGKLRDKELAKRFDTVNTKEAARSLGFDTVRTWEPFSESNTLRFIPKEWIFSAVSQVGVVVIHTALELIELSRRINEGARELASATIQLAQDIDLGGKEWEPIGSELSKAFKGVFDGCGHTVSNFVIKAKNVRAKGFFGYLKGEVYNLTVDCVIKAGNADVAGGIAAYCEEGVIGCCAAIAAIKCGRVGLYGGLVGANTGRVFNSYAAGSITSSMLSWTWLALLPVLLFLLLLLLQMLLPKPDVPDSLPVFAPVPVDINIQPIPGAASAPENDGNFVSFQFEQIIDVNIDTGECIINFRNPGSSNHDMVVQLQLTDAQAINIMGSTGRTAAEQQKLDANPRYDPENYRTTIAESGAIPPGFQLDSLMLTEQPDGAVLQPGGYNAIVYLIFYDVNTYNRAMLETQLPVYMNVHN